MTKQKEITIKQRLVGEALLVRTGRNRLVRDLMDAGLSQPQAVEVAILMIRPRTIDGVIPLVTERPRPALRLEECDHGPRAAGSFLGAARSPETSPRSER
jgi:hypothetical protein